MRIAFLGAHRCGKTTLVKALSEKTGIPVLLSDASAIFKLKRLAPDQEMSESMRLGIQGQIAASHWKRVTDAGDSFFSDRSFLDFGMYVQLMVHQGITERMIDRCARSYVSRRIEDAAKAYDRIYAIPSVLDFVEEEGKFKRDDAQIALLEEIIDTFAHDYRVKNIVRHLPRSVVDLNERVDWVMRDMKSNIILPRE